MFWMIVVYNNIEIEITDYEFLHDEGFYIINAIYVGTGKELGDAAIEQLETAKQSELYQRCLENAMSHAYDRAKDRRKYGE